MIVCVAVLTLFQAPVVPHAEVLPLRRELLTAVDAIESHLVHMQAIALASSVPVLMPAERAALDARYQAHIGSIDEIAHSTYWHRVPLLDAGGQQLELQLHPRSDETVALKLACLTAASQGLTGDVTTAANASAELSNIAAALVSTVSYRRSAAKTFRLALGTRAARIRGSLYCGCRKPRNAP